MTETYVINVYNGEIHHPDDWRIVEVASDEMFNLLNMESKQRQEFAANNGTFIPKGKQ
jgi:predicted SAM-dependent methyltransferase